MAENMIDFVAPIEDKMQNIIQVIGVGGGGCNAVSRMDNEGIQGVAFAVCNTDSASLKHSPVAVKLQLGEAEQATDNEGLPIRVGEL